MRPHVMVGLIGTSAETVRLCQLTCCASKSAQKCACAQTKSPTLNSVTACACNDSQSANLCPALVGGAFFIQRIIGVSSNAQKHRRALHPDEAYITGSAGSVGFFNGQTWHRSTKNQSQRTRRVYHCALTAHENAQQTDQRKLLLPKIEARLIPATRYILDV